MVSGKTNKDILVKQEDEFSDKITDEFDYMCFLTLGTPLILDVNVGNIWNSWLPISTSFLLKFETYLWEIKYFVSFFPWFFKCINILYQIKKNCFHWKKHQGGDTSEILKPIWHRYQSP